MPKQTAATDVDWGAKAPGFLRRVHRERHAAYRAIAPAWPVGLVAVTTILIFLVMDQARDSLLFTASGPLSAALAFAIVLGLFSFCLMQSALYLMSVKRRYVHAASDSPIAPPDTHPSIGLRILTAFVLGVAPALVLIGILMINLTWVGTGWIFPAIVLAAAAAAALAFVVSSRFQLALDDGRARDRRDSNVRALDAASVMLAEPDTSGSGSGMPMLKRMRLRIAIGARRWLIRPFYGLVFPVQGALRWVTKPDSLAIVCVALVLSTTLLLAPPKVASPAGVLQYDSQAHFSILLAIAMVAAFSLVFVRSYDRWMRVVGARERRELVADTRIQMMTRGWTFISIVMCLAVFWTGYYHPAVYATIGPATALLMGLFLVLSVLGFFVRTAIAPADHAVPLYKGARWQEFLVLAGRASWWLQGLLASHRVFAFGVTLLALDWSIALIEFLWPKEAGGGLILAWLAVLVAFAAALAAGWAGSACATWLGLGRRPKLPRFQDLVRPPAPENTPRIGSLLLLAPFLLATLGEDRRPHYVFLDKADAGVAEAMKPRPSLQQAAAAWLEQRREQERITAVVVLAEGGGIRSAIHISQLLSELDQRRSKPLFEDIFALAGVSGGAVGLSAFLAANAQSTEPSQRDQFMDGMLGADHMTPLIAGMFGSDLPSIFVPFDILPRLQRMTSPKSYLEDAPSAFVPSRADFFEASIADAWRQAAKEPHAGVGNWMTQPLSHVVAEASQGMATPIVLFPTFGVEGLRGVVSNVVFDDCANAADGRFVDVLSCLGLREGNVHRAPSMDMPIAAAAHLSARFPGSNPPALFDACDLGDTGACRLRGLRFVDGGYFDNSGAAATREAVDALVRAARESNDKAVLDRLHIVVIHAYFRDETSRTDEARFSRSLNEVLAPWDGVWSARSGSGQFPVASFCRDLIGRAEAHDECDICASVAANRTWTSDESVSQPICSISDQAPPCPVRLFEGPAPQVDWFAAPINNHAAAAADKHYLLGWTLQANARDQMRGEVRRTAAYIADALPEIFPSAVSTGSRSSQLPLSGCRVNIRYAG